MSVELFEDQYKGAYIYTPELTPALAFEKQQLDFLWRADEMLVEQDRHTLLTETTPAEKHALLTVLKTFTHYEVRAGNDYWLNKVLNTFAPVEIKRMATINGFVENVSHAPFYNRINEALYVNDAAFYNDYLKDPVLAEHMAFVDQAAQGDNLLLSLATFSLIEGAVLYSSFAVLKAFRANGYNKMGAIANGVNLSERDESLHSAGGAWLYLITRKHGRLPEAEKQVCDAVLPETIRKLVAHEDHIIDLVFEQGEFCGLTKHDMQAWVRERVNHCLKQLRMQPMYDVGRTKIGSWFNTEAKGITHTDFFDGMPKYRKGFPLEGFDFSSLIEG